MSRVAALFAIVFAWCWAVPVLAQGASADDDALAATLASHAQRDRVLIDARLQAMPAQRPGTIDLYAIGFAGDGEENVFRNEVAYFETLATVRHGAQERTLSLVNHPDSLGKEPRPLATLDNLRLALAGVGAAMDPDEDLLMLFITTHGTPAHRLSVRMPDLFDTSITPKQLRAALDDAGVRHRILIVSACYSGGFVPALATPDTLVITAARRDRPSFGCGDRTTATYFGRAFLVEGMNRDGGLLDAFAYAKRQVSRRETMEDFLPSEPQISIGEAILPRIEAWEATLERGPAVPYPHAL